MAEQSVKPTRKRRPKKQLGTVLDSEDCLRDRGLGWWLKYLDVNRLFHRGLSQRIEFAPRQVVQIIPFPTWRDLLYKRVVIYKTTEVLAA